MILLRFSESYEVSEAALYNLRDGAACLMDWVPLHLHLKLAENPSVDLREWRWLLSGFIGFTCKTSISVSDERSWCLYP